ncbi:hypothetical protein HU200_018020 [Digitaria exilis]|uniref:Cytochrome P450 n=1 Tax=Digitaria exilis TaxID=1010633 RepID=A0A835F587_9POAL|nr:hypothetical protein HU200_018020 [Digitaria exilis]
MQPPQSTQPDQPAQPAAPLPAVVQNAKSIEISVGRDHLKTDTDTARTVGRRNRASTDMIDLIYINTSQIAHHHFLRWSSHNHRRRRPLSPPASSASTSSHHASTLRRDGARITVVVDLLPHRRARRRSLLHRDHYPPPPARQAQAQAPTGPRPRPVIGNLNLIGTLPHRSIHELSSLYGHLMCLRFGSFPVVVASSADMARSFLKTHDLAFIDRPKTAAGKYTTYNYSGLFSSPYGPRLASLHHVRADEVRSTLNGLHAAVAGGEHAVELREHLYMVNLNVISRMVLGKKYVVDGAGSPTTPEEFSRMIDEHFFLNGVLNVGDLIPWLGWLDVQGYVKRMKRSAKMFDHFLEHVLDEHDERRRRRDGNEFVAKDMVDVLLELADDPNLEVPIERYGVKGFTLDFIGGGTDTSAVTVEWAMSELLRNPEVLAKANEEMDRVISRECLVEEEDITRLPYLEAVVKETMRLHPVGPLLTPRLCREDVSLGGYDIPAGTRVLINVWTISRDPAVWDAPMEFRPERFVGGGSGGGVDVKGQDFELLPFGSGRRMCPGMSLGLKMVQVILANLVHAFAPSPSLGSQLASMLPREAYAKICRCRKYNLPPAPRPWPVIGNLNLIDSRPVGAAGDRVLHTSP